jgi:hypothetical protein
MAIVLGSRSTCIFQEIFFDNRCSKIYVNIQLTCKTHMLISIFYNREEARNRRTPTQIFCYKVPQQGGVEIKYFVIRYRKI